MLLAGSSDGQVSSLRCTSLIGRGIEVLSCQRFISLKPSAPRVGNDHQLLVQTLTPSAKSPLLALARRIADAGCNLADSRVSTIGSDSSVMLLATGAWDAIAKLETSLTKLDRDNDMHLVHYRADPREPNSHLLPYLVEVVSADRPGILVKIMDFFARQGVTVEQLTSMRYHAMQTGAEMFQAQITIGIPAESHIASLRDDFLELCDGLNLDAILDPVKF